jgi:hypothetical protein
LTDELETFKQSSINYKAQVGLLQDRLKIMEEEENNFRKVKFNTKSNFSLSE